MPASGRGVYMRKRIFALALAALILISAVAAVSLAPVRFAEAETDPDVIYIDSEADWEAFITQGQAQTFENKTVELRTDLYFYSRNATPNLIQNRILRNFLGTFEGNGHSLVGLRISYDGSDYPYGFFRGLGVGAVVRNLNIVDFLGDGIAAILCGANEGTVSNVKIQGKIINSTLAGGISYANKGTITGCVAAMEFSGTEFATMAYHNKGTVTANHSVLSVIQVLDEREGGTSDMPANTLIDDGYIDNYFELFYFKDGAIADAVFSKDINLYGQDLPFLSNLTSGNLGDYYFYNYNFDIALAPSGFSGYTTAEELPGLSELIISGTGAEGDPYVLFAEGDGSLNNPFRVADYKDLQRIAYIYAHPEEWESFGLEGRLYFRQTADISLLKEGEGKYYKIDIPDFGGEYDGAGRSVTGVIDSLFDSTKPDEGYVKRLNVRGEVRTGGEALVVRENNGVVENVYANVNIAVQTEDNFTAGGLVYTNKTLIALCEVSANALQPGNYGAIAYSTENSILVSASYSGDMPFVYEYQSANPGYVDIYACYNEGMAWIGTDPETTDVPGVSYSGGELHFGAGMSPYGLLNAFDPYSGWKWGLQAESFGEGPSLSYRRWCVLAGQTEDFFVFRRHFDKPQYKISGPLTLRSDLGFEDNTLSKEYDPYNPVGPNYVNVKADWFDLDPSDLDRISYFWTYSHDPDNIQHHNDFTGAVFGVGTYTFVFTQEPDENNTRRTVTAYYEITEIDLSYNIYSFRIKNDAIKALLPIPGIIYNYPPTDKPTGTKTVNGVRYEFLDDAGVRIGEELYTYGEDPDDVPYVYNAEEWFDPQVIVPFYAPADATVYPSVSIVNAGQYDITITIECPNYVTKTVSMRVKISPKPVRVRPFIDTEDGKIVYKQPLRVGYTLNGEDLFENITADELADFGYYTAYTVGSPVGNYQLAIVNRGVKHRNYTPVIQTPTIAFEVVRANASDADGYNDIAFEGKSTVYNGKWQTLEATGVSGDFYVEYRYNGQQKNAFIDAGTYEIEAYIYIKGAGGGRDDNYNYGEPLRATLHIDPKPVTIKVKDYPTPINYNDELPPDILFEIETPLNEYSIGVRDDGTRDVFDFTFECTYYKGAPAGLYDIILTGIPNPNYNIVSRLPGKLTVNKIARGYDSLIFNTRKVYDGYAFAPSFIEGVLNEITAGTAEVQYYLRGNEGPLEGAPVNAGEYTLKVVFEGSPYYVDETLPTDFDILKAGLEVVDIRFLFNSQEGKLITSTLPSDYVYDKQSYSAFTPTIAISGLPVGANFTITYFYTFGGQQFEVTDNALYLEKGVGMYSNIRAEISGNPNYNGLTLYAGSVHYKPRVLYIDYTVSAQYRAEDITLSLTIINFDDVLESDLALIPDETAVSYTLIGASEIRNAGTYRFTASVASHNYVVLTSGDDPEFIFVVEKALVPINMDDIGVYEVTYGQGGPTFDKSVTYYVGDNAETATLRFTTNRTQFSGAGIYNVTAVAHTDPVGAANVMFVIVEGTGAGKYIVHKKEVSFSWTPRFAAEYEYNGRVRTDIMGISIPDDQLSGRIPPDNIGVRLSFDREVKDAGTYTVTASLINASNYTLVGDLTYTFRVTKAPIIVHADDFTIDYNQPPPEFTATVSWLKGDDTADMIPVSFSCSYKQGDNAGTYDIYVTAGDTQNYEVIQSDKGTLTVNRIRQTGITKDNPQPRVYNGQPWTYHPPMQNGGTSEVDCAPVNAGEHTVKVTVTLNDNYFVEEFFVTLTILPATPVIEVSPISVNYLADGQKLGDELITGRAYFKPFPDSEEAEIEGKFAFSPQSPTLFGAVRDYTVVFTPSSANFTEVTGSVRITPVFTDIEQKITFAFFEGGIKDGKIRSTTDNIVLVISVNRDIDDGIELYVNGEKLPNMTIEVSEGVNTLDIEIRKNGTLLASYSYEVLYNQEEDEGENGGGNNGGGNNGGGGPTVKPQIPTGKKVDWAKVGIIAGSVAGGIAVIALIAIIIVRVKAKKE
jgi:hypothetical protein